MKLTKVLTTAAAAVSMMAASTAFAAAPAAAKLSVSNASAVKALRAGGINKNAKSNSLPSWLPPVVGGAAIIGGIIIIADDSDAVSP